MPTNKGRKQQNLAYHRPTKTRKPMPRVNEAQTAIMRTVHGHSNTCAGVEVAQERGES
jgi:hypothetical protein